MSELPLRQVIQGDCLDVMRTFSSGLFDCIITDPPYNIGIDEWDEKNKVDPFFNSRWLRECQRLLKPASYLWVTVGCTKASEIELAIREFDDLRLKNCIPWYRMDGWKGDNGFAKSHEHILLFIKDKLPEQEHHRFMKYLNERRTVLGLSLNDINETLGYATSGGGNASNWMGDKNDNSLPTRPDYYRLKTLLQLDSQYDYLPFPKLIKIRKVDSWDDVWTDIRSEHHRCGHPTQKPEKLIARMIEATTDKDDVVLDPFLGSGTTALVCEKLRRKWIGIEINSEYCEIARKRLEPWMNQSRLDSLV